MTGRAILSKRALVEIIRGMAGEAVRRCALELHILMTVATGNIAVPVSYTHLRAHETVLDIVCRLLLEKKTHKTS